MSSAPLLSSCNREFCAAARARVPCITECTTSPLQMHPHHARVHSRAMVRPSLCPSHSVAAWLHVTSVPVNLWQPHRCLLWPAAVDEAACFAAAEGQEGVSRVKGCLRSYLPTATRTCGQPNANTLKQRNADKAEQKSSNADKDHNRGQMERWKAQAKGRKAERSDERDRRERRWGQARALLRQRVRPASNARRPCERRESKTKTKQK